MSGSAKFRYARHSNVRLDVSARGGEKARAHIYMKLSNYYLPPVFGNSITAFIISYTLSFPSLVLTLYEETV
jgi:hypothetical protein